MAARAIWKGVIKIGKTALPVKLYSAVQDRSIRFRLLHEKDRAPVAQRMVEAASGDVVDPKDIRMAYPVNRSTLVILEDQELTQLEPQESRDIDVTRFVSEEDIDHRWYDRAYYLGPDGASDDYFALAAALEDSGKEGVAQWVMRSRAYIGALRGENGRLMLIVLRHADEVIAAEELQPPGGRALEKREIAMAEQLVSALSGKFDPGEFRNEHRQRIMELIETKAHGGKVKVKKFRPRPTEDKSLDRALEASLATMGKKRAAGGRR